MKFSVVVCTYNREKYIQGSLRSVFEQDFDKTCFELLVIDNNSPDNTAVITKSVAGEYPDIVFRYYLETNQGISFARNRGIKEASGDFIVFVDDDETIEKDYLSKLNNFLKAHPDVQLCGVPVYPVYEAEKPKWLSHFTLRLMTGYYYLGNEVKKVEAKDYPGTGHAIIKKELFEKYGDFNVELGRKGNSLLGAEDKDMFLRLIGNNVACYYFPDIAIYHHIPKEKLTDDYFQRLTHSIGISERIRTKSISDKAYNKRLFGEWIKWAASILLFFGYALSFTPSKGIKLLQFRWNVTKGLLGK